MKSSRLPLHASKDVKSDLILDTQHQNTVAAVENPAFDDVCDCQLNHDDYHVIGRYCLTLPDIARTDVGNLNL